MFPEYQDLINHLLKTDNHFSTLFKRHADLNNEITKITNNAVITANTPQLSELKKEKLDLKDKIYALLKQHQ